MLDNHNLKMLLNYYISIFTNISFTISEFCNWPKCRKIYGNATQNMKKMCTFEKSTEKSKILNTRNLLVRDSPHCNVRVDHICLKYK